MAGSAVPTGASVDLQPLAGLTGRLTRESRELAATSALWQERARVLEGRLLALRAAPGGGAPSPWWRRWWRRVTGG